MQKGHTNNPNGRKLGSKNKYTNSVKEVFFEVFEKRGGATWLEKWLDKDAANETVYFKLLASFEPRQNNVHIDTTLTIEDRAIRAAGEFFEGIVVNAPASSVSSEPPALPDGSVLSS